MLKVESFLLLLCVLLCTMVQAQNGNVGIGTIIPNENAILHLVSPEKNKGFLLPSFTTDERNAASFTGNLGAADNGLMVYDSDINKVLIWKEDHWDIIGAGERSYYGVDPSDFTPLLKSNSELDKNHLLIFEDNSDFVTLRITTRASEIMAPLHLPHGSVIEEVEIYFWDDAGPDITVDILRKPYAGASESILSTPWLSAGKNAEIQNATLDNFIHPSIDNESYSYRVRASTFYGGTEIRKPDDAAHRIYGLRIKYSY